MLKNAIEVLKILEQAGFEAYIIGGYPRNRFLGIESHDIDICTSAKPMEISLLFECANLRYEKSGVVTVTHCENDYEVTTFRHDIKTDGRKVLEVKFIDSFLEDLNRRDFVINTLALNSNLEYIDFLNAKEDLNNKIIRTVKESSISFKEDSLRILRAIRFTTILNFNLSNQVIQSIKENCHLVKDLSYYRKRQELDLIFKSKYVKRGIDLLVENGLDTYLELDFKGIDYKKDLLGIWSQLDYQKYPFTKIERRILNDLKLSNP